MTAFFTWLLTTKVGRAVAATTLVAITLVTSWYFFSSHYTKAGYDACQAEHALAVAEDNIKVNEAQNKRDATTDKISDKADDTAAEVIEKTNTDTNETKTAIRTVYKDRVVTVPTVAGSCVHPVDSKVQSAIQDAWKSAYD